MYVQAPARAMREWDMVLTTNTTACPEIDTCGAQYKCGSTQKEAQGVCHKARSNSQGRDC